MLVYVATRHRIFRGAGSVICLPATSAMIVQAMQMLAAKYIDVLQNNTRILKTTPKTQVSYSETMCYCMCMNIFNLQTRNCVNLASIIVELTLCAHGRPFGLRGCPK